MCRRIWPCLIYLTIAGLVLTACNNTTPTATPTPDSAAFNAAVETAVALTRAAEAPTSTPAPLVPTATPLPPTVALPTPTSPPPTPTSVEVTSSPTEPNVPPTPSPTFTPPPPTPTPPQLVSIPPDGGQSNLQGSIILPGYLPEQVSDPMVFRDQIVLRVEVYDPDFGHQDGAGIRNVEFTITRDDGDDTTLYQHTENTPGYCAFGGGEPNCNVLVYAQTNNRWPDTNLPIVDGPHRAFMQINRQNGDSENWNWGFEIRGALPQAAEPSDITAEVVQTGPGTNANIVSGALVFQVFASTDGNQDGAGIDRVDMRIIGPHGEVHQRTEQNAAYCAFSGGEPNCNVWDFAQHNNRWPNGDPIEPGDYTLRAIIHAQDGNSTTIEKSIEIH